MLEDRLKILIMQFETILNDESSEKIDIESAYYNLLYDTHSELSNFFDAYNLKSLLTDFHLIETGEY